MPLIKRQMMKISEMLKRSRGSVDWLKPNWGPAMLVVILSDITSYTYLLLNISRMTGMMKVNIFVTGCIWPPEKIFLENFKMGRRCNFQSKTNYNINKRAAWLHIRVLFSFLNPWYFGWNFWPSSSWRETYCWDKLNLNLINLAE